MYTYDYANRLTKVEENQTTVGEYVYDGDGKRIQVTENSMTTTSIYSGLTVLYEENSTGTAAYIYGPRGRLAKRTTINGESNTFYYHTDHLGSTRLVTDDTKNIVSAVTYHPFGEVYSEEGSEDFLFNGKEKDATGLYYYGARYYDPEIGRFMTRDPLGGVMLKPQSLNRYTYCLNNPLKYVDPAGLNARFSKDDEARAAWQDERAKKRRQQQASDMLSLRKIEYVDSYEEAFLVIKTPIQYSSDGRVGTAIGYCYPGNVFVNHVLFGLVIFFFDEEGNILEVIFIPFNDFGDEKKMRAHGRLIKTLLKHMNTPFGSLTEALRNLIFYCDQQGDESSIIAFVSGIGIGGAAFAAGMTNPAGWFLILLTSGAAGMMDFQWDSWRDKIFYFLDFIEEL